MKAQEKVLGRRHIQFESRRDDTEMGHSYSNVLVHVVFSTKNRAKIITCDRKKTFGDT